MPYPDFEEFDPLPLTTEGLIKLLAKYDPVSQSDDVTVPTPLAILPAPPQEFRLKWHPTLGDVLRQRQQQTHVDIIAYQALKEKVQAHQMRHGISGIETNRLTIAGEDISHPYSSYKLLLLDSDIPILKAAIPQVVEQFEKLAQLLPDHRLYKEVWNEEIEEGDCDWIPVKITEVHAFSAIAVMASIITIEDRILGGDPLIVLTFYFGTSPVSDRVVFVLTPNL